MKNTILKTAILAILIFSTQAMNAQLSIAEKTTEHDDAQRPCIEVKLQPETDEVKDEWKDYVKDAHDVKMRGTGFLANKDVMYAEEVTIEKISPKAINFYTRVVEDGDQTMMCVFGSFGYDVHISPEKYPQEWAAMKNMVSSFLQKYLPSFYQDIIDETQGRLSDLKDEKSDMEEEMTENKKEIEKLTKRNEELKEKLSENQQKLETANTKLVSEKQSLKEVKIQLQKLN